MNLALNLEDNLAGLGPAAWLAALDRIGDSHGALHRLGPAHHALFIDAGRSLLVTFETLQSARRNPGATPRGLGFVSRNGWSLMAFLSDGETWFRDPALWGTFDRLVQDGFFEDFDRVLFFGEGSCGYAACAYSIAAPGARVLALRPQATLDPRIAGWDNRFPDARQRDFATRYGYAPDMLEGACEAHVLFDPLNRIDARHAGLFRRPNVLLLPCPYSGQNLDLLVQRMQIDRPLIEAAMDSRLDRLAFARLWRARRTCPAYLRSLLDSARSSGHGELAATVQRHVRRIRDHALAEPATPPPPLPHLMTAVPRRPDHPPTAPVQ